MTQYSGKLSLSAKLLLIGIIPLMLLIYYSVEIYRGNKQKLLIMQDYIHQVEISALLSHLNESLGQERRFSYMYLRNNIQYKDLLAQRRITDALIEKARARPELTLKNFKQYTFLNQLGAIRLQLDSFPETDPNYITDYYTRTIFRLNSLGGSIPQSGIYLTGNYRDLIAQRILSEIITLLDILRTNVYNVLFTRQYMVETLMGSYGAYTTYNTYFKEYDVKASESAKKVLDSIMQNPAFLSMNQYLDSLFTRFQFDSSLNASQWWALSSTGISGLKQIQNDIWKKVDQRLSAQYQQEEQEQAYTIVFLIIIILLVVLLILFTIISIRENIMELKMAARRISRGQTGIKLTGMPPGMIGSLARSIMEIEKNYLVLAQAALEIGKGNFDVKINPRSDEDTLALAIKKMQQDLHAFTVQKDQLQKDTMDLVYQRDEFFSMTSHELKTPLTTIKACTQLLLMDGETTGAPRIELLQRIERQTNKLASLINDVLDISRLQYGHLAYNKVVADLGKILDDVINELALAYPEREIIYKGSTHGEIIADPLRISQVVHNLLSNAIKYSPADKEVIVQLNVQDQKAVVSVQDFGHGIPEGNKEKIFERFYRIPGADLHTYPGLGLGLFISKEIIQKHNGKIWLESTPGAGSTFFFELPLNEVVS